MSKARAQSSKRKMMRTLYGSQNPAPNSSKRTGMRLQVINLWPPKKKGRKTKRRKWLERIPVHLGAIKYIYHQQIPSPVELEELEEEQTKETTSITTKQD